jgi:hypothetical protein
MSDIVPALRSELQAVSAQVRVLESAVTDAQERLRKASDRAEKLKGLLATYEVDEPSRPALSQTELAIIPKASEGPQRRMPTQEWRGETKKSRMEQEITNLLLLRGSVHRSNILDHMTAKGIMGSEKGPMAHLAAFLSDHKETFASDGKGNFCLRRNGPHEPPPAPNGAGFAGMEEAGTTSAHP